LLLAMTSSFSVEPPLQSRGKASTMLMSAAGSRAQKKKALPADASACACPVEHTGPVACADAHQLGHALAGAPAGRLIPRHRVRPRGDSGPQWRCARPSPLPWTDLVVIVVAWSGGRLPGRALPARVRPFRSSSAAALAWMRLRWKSAPAARLCDRQPRRSPAGYRRGRAVASTRPWLSAGAAPRRPGVSPGRWGRPDDRVGAIARLPLRVRGQPGGVS
jgi:hypothetical protein